MKIRFLLLFLFLLLFSNGFAQTKVDSLKTQLESTQSALDSLTLLQELSSLSMRSSIEESVAFSKMYFDLAEREQDAQHIYDANFRLGVVFKYKGEYDSSLVYLEKALNQAIEMEDSTSMGRCYNAFGVVYKTSGKFLKAEEYYELALELARERNDYQNQAKIYNNLGLLLQIQGKYAEALEHFRPSIELKHKLNDTKGLIVSYNNIGLNFTNLDQFANAIEHYQIGLEFSEKINDKYSQGVLTNNMGEAYLQLDSIDQAIRFLNRSIEVRLQIEDEIGLAKSYFHFGNLWAKLKKYDRSERYYKDAIFILESKNKLDELNAVYQALGKLKYENEFYSSAIKWFQKAQNNAERIQSRSDQLINFEYLAKCFFKLNKFDSAYAYLDKAKSLSDQLQDLEVEQKLQEQQMRYEAEFNQNTIRQLREAQSIQEVEREKDRIVFYVVLASLILAGGLIVLLFRQNQLKKRYAKELESHNIHIEKQNKNLEKAKLKAEEASRVKSDFLASVSHEIKTPLNGINGMTELLQSTQLNSTQRNYLSTIKNSSDNLLILMNDILDFAKIESSNLQLDIRRNSLKGLLENIYKSFEENAKSKELNFDLEIQEDVPDYVYVDASRLKQVISNLLSNSFKFTHLGFVTLKIDVISKEKTFNGEKVSLRFSVSDSGVGISGELKSRIIDAFNQADSSITRKYGGVGLGLAISHSLIELMGGSLEIESEVSRGTEVYFTLDLKADKNNPHEKASTIRDKNRRENLSETGIRYPLNICIAEDNEINQELLKVTLQKMGYDPLIVENGGELLEKMHDYSVDLIFMDIQMPIVDGITATKEIRAKKENTAEYPIIVAVTANTFNEDKSRYLTAGMNDYIPKPFTTADIHQAITKWYPTIAGYQKEKDD